MQRVNLHARPSIIQAGCPTCCYQVCALDHAKGGTADLDHPSKPCHHDDSSIASATGTANRTVASTQMNATSSRAHTVVTITFDQIIKNAGGQETKKSSVINLVDLAGKSLQF